MCARLTRDRNRPRRSTVSAESLPRYQFREVSSNCVDQQALWAAGSALSLLWPLFGLKAIADSEHNFSAVERGGFWQPPTAAATSVLRARTERPATKTSLQSTFSRCGSAMNAKLKSPRIVFGYREGHKIRLGLGYLIRRQNGQHWCCPGPEDQFGREPVATGAILLTPSLLEEHAVPGSETIYLYQSLISVLPRGWGRPATPQLAETQRVIDHGARLIEAEIERKRPGSGG
jgi:hypothetical protein